VAAATGARIFRGALKKIRSPDILHKNRGRPGGGSNLRSRRGR